MKIYLVLLLFFGFGSHAQTIVPVEKTEEYMDAGNGIPDDTYLKDVNNLLSKYEGTWKGTYGGKNYTFYVTKYTSKFEKVTRDKLLTRYLITTSNGAILEDTRSLSDTSPYVIKGNYFGKDLRSYASNFFGKNSQCGNKGTVFIQIKNITKTQMSLSFEPDKIMISDEDCPGFKLAELTLPRDGMMLTKQ